MVPTPEKNRVVDGGNPVSTGTRKVAPNIATTCCSPMLTVRGHVRRSSGATTVFVVSVHDSKFWDLVPPGSVMRNSLRYSRLARSPHPPATPPRAYATRLIYTLLHSALLQC